ncbi:SPOR domain-containing protein [Vibrio sp. AND4]|uniref:SPOR domain-containing protein n=1 Tax=Vibrio sp. AND4 TaxID=314289 RepID=UPI00015F2DD7|nr:SPOR domain-containing protein [Vibrio sp. AND4]EDP58782.1 hypothetical protein AND4_17284 [Vibrio sp. AND4]
MEMKKAHKLSRLTQLGLSLGLLVAGAQFASPVLAEDFLCQASQASNKELPVLERACPIGRGVWGKKVPQGGNQFFWIQCGLLPKPMSLAKAKPIYSKITTDVWVKPEQKGYRCLIGPYTEFAKASQDLQRVKTLSTYKDAFIRAVGKGSTAPVKQTKPKPPVATPKPVAPAVSASRPDTSAFKSKGKTSPKQAPQMPARASKESKPAQPMRSNDNVQVRLKTILQGKTFVVPYLADNDNQFYMEFGKPWNRLNYASSKQVCRQLSMDVVSVSEFKLLRASGVMEKNNWPLQLPYWGKGKKGLFTDRASNQLTGSSLLNVICVK